MASISILVADGAVIAALLSCLISLAGDRRPRFFQRGSFLLLGVSGPGAVVAGLTPVITATISTQTLILGLPWLNRHLRLDILSGWFLMMIGVVTVAVAVYGPGYVLEFTHGPHSLAVLGCFTGLFITGMELVGIESESVRLRRGRAILHYDGENFEVPETQSVYYAPRRSHNWRNPHKQLCELHVMRQR